MATPGTLYFGLTFDRIIDGTTTGYKWALNADRTVDWSISNGFDGERWTNPEVVYTHAQQMLHVYSTFANIKFNYVGYYTTPTVAYQAGSEINFTLSGSPIAFPSSGYWARAFFPKPTAQANYYYGGRRCCLKHQEPGELLAFL